MENEENDMNPVLIFTEHFEFPKSRETRVEYRYFLSKINGMKILREIVRTEFQNDGEISTSKMEFVSLQEICEHIIKNVRDIKIVAGSEIPDEFIEEEFGWGDCFEDFG